MWYDCHCDSHPPNAKQRTIKLLKVTTQSLMMGKTHTIKQAVKGPKINDVKLFIKDENQPNLQKTDNNEHEDINNHRITGSWLRTGP